MIAGLSPDGQIYATTTNYLCNEWLDDGGFEGVQHHEGKQPPALQSGWPWVVGALWMA